MSFLSQLFGGSSSSTSAERIDGARARALVAEGAFLLDVRTASEFRSGHIEGAVNIPVDQVARRVGELPKATPIVLYCRSGSRSTRAGALLASRVDGPVPLRRVCSQRLAMM